MEKSNFLKNKPMLLSEIHKPFNDKNYLFEIKFDGIRALIYINKDEIIIKSRNNIILNDIYPELVNIKNITSNECIFDGEIVLIENGVPNFLKLQERTRLKNIDKITFMIKNYPVTFVAFDILYENKDLTKQPLYERKEILNKYMDTDFFFKSKYFLEKGTQLFKAIELENLEGIVAKKINSTYTYNKRSKNWLKIKNFIKEDFIICGYSNNKNNTVSLVLGEFIKNKYYYVGKIVVSKNNQLFKKIVIEKQTKNYLENYKKVNYTYIKPKHTIKISYLERTKNNLLRGAFINKN